VIDESYNANPASMAAALALLATAPGRKLAVLGDMLEMGEEGPKFHAALADAIEAAHTDLVFASGPQMKSLWDTLPYSRRGAYAENSAGLVAKLTASLQPGDTVLVKGSLGSRMAVIVEALKEKAG
jgi:UDP-N-acetylmuramoyl-tripeptide--D-alanyl-D-alanine ligase